MPQESSQAQCREEILSEEYYDILLSEPAYAGELRELPGACFQEVNGQIQVAYVPGEAVPPLTDPRYTYGGIPKLYGLMDETALEASGITRVADLPSLALKGQGVLIGFVDTGIDYTHPVFRDTLGRSRIAAVWDQQDQSGTPPEGFDYGTLYEQEELNRALRAEDPFEVVPQLDTDGHGTFLAGVAAGSRQEQEAFSGAAPEAVIAAVRLKPAKQYLRDYYRVAEDSQAYQESDILLGVAWLRRLQERLDMPLVVCLGLGTNLGGHDDCCVLGGYLGEVGQALRTAVVCPAGNEGGRAHHYRGFVNAGQSYEDVEIQVEEGNTGFTLELWSDWSELYRVGFLSPTGEIALGMEGNFSQTMTYNFLFEQTEVTVTYRLVNYAAGSNQVTIRFLNPAGGIWRVRVYNAIYTNGVYDLWLPIESFNSSGVRFLRPDADITLTVPSSVNAVIAAAAYDHTSNSLFVNSGRGYSRIGEVRPALAAPGVDITGPLPGGRYTARTGTSVAAAITAGAAASLLTWASVQGNMPYLSGSGVQYYLSAGARRRNGVTYPNREWGYGSLDLFRVFEVIRDLVR